MHKGTVKRKKKFKYQFIPNVGNLDYYFLFENLFANALDVLRSLV
jgi:hypothetical protein